MDANHLEIFLGLVMLVVMGFHAYVISSMAWHHARIKKKASKLLLVHGLLESMFPFFAFLGFLTRLDIMLLNFLAFDFLIASWIVFDVLYGHFFHDGSGYKGIVSRPFLLVFILFGISHYVVLTYDLTSDGDLIYTIPGLLFIGLALTCHVLYREMVQMKDLRAYVALEVNRVDVSEKWKVKLVMKQYNFLYLQFKVNTVACIMYTFALVVFLFGGIGVTAVVFFCGSAVLFLVGKGCQLLGFFYPVPQWKAALDAGSG